MYNICMQANYSIDLFICKHSHFKSRHAITFFMTERKSLEILNFQNGCFLTCYLHLNILMIKKKKMNYQLL